MNIIAHRGFWSKPEEKNSLNAMKKAFKNGYGIETDIRDYMGKLVISHNIADGSCLNIESLFEAYKDLVCEQTLALNVKADGIQDSLEILLKKYKIVNYFMFDMSIPEQVIYHDRKFNYYARRSDIETECVQYDDANGVWVDGFYSTEWLDGNLIQSFLKDGKKVCLVSPELHKKDHKELWKMLKKGNMYCNKLFSLCTDIPDKAKEYFYDED